MPSWADFQPYIVTGLALGGIYALSGVGLVVLYRATGVLNLAFGAVGAMGAYIAYSIIQAGNPGWLGWVVCILFGGVVTVGYEFHCHTLEHQGNSFRVEDADPIAREACRQIHAWYTELFAEMVRDEFTVRQLP